MAVVGGNERISPQGGSVSNHHSPDALHLAIHGQRIYTPFTRSPGEGMEDPLSDVSSEEIFPIGKFSGSFVLGNGNLWDA